MAWATPFSSSGGSNRMLLSGITAAEVFSNIAVFISGIALGIALESWLRTRNHV